MSWARAFGEGVEVTPLLHGGFRAAYEGLAAALAAGAPVVCVASEAGCGKSTLLRSLAVFRPRAALAVLAGGGKVDLADGEVVDVWRLHTVCFGKDRAGLVLAAELHGGEPPAREILQAARRVFDLAREEVHLVLAGGGEEVAELASGECLSLRDPVMLRLAPVPLEETLRYIHHRLSQFEAPPVEVAEEAAAAIGGAAGGIPVRINALCRKVLTRAFLEGRREVTADLVEGVLDA